MELNSHTSIENLIGWERDYFIPSIVSGSFSVFFSSLVSPHWDTDLADSLCCYLQLFLLIYFNVVVSSTSIQAELNCKWLHAALCPSFLSQEINTVMGERIQQRSYSLLKLGQYSPVQQTGKLDFSPPEF